eukprot:3723-Heterococcus_DN1.PRE.3
MAPAEVFAIWSDCCSAMQVAYQVSCLLTGVPIVIHKNSGLLPNDVYAKGAAPSSSSTCQQRTWLLSAWRGAQKL